MTRCKVGDLCVVVKDDEYPENIGKMVSIVRRARWGYDYAAWECKPHSNFRADECFTDGEVRRAGLLGMVNVDLPDSDLRPIRDNPGQDESLTWKNVPIPQPTKETA